MKPLRSILLFSTVVAIWVAARPTNVVTDLNMTTPEVYDQVFYQLSAEHPQASLSYKTRQIGKQLSASARASAVRAMGAVVRTYVQSADFRNRYDRWMRDQYRVSDAQTDAAKQAESASINTMHTAVNQQLAQTRAAFAHMPHAALTMMIQQQITQTQEQLTDADSKATLTHDLITLKQLQGLANTKPAEFKMQYIAFMSRYMTRQMNNELAEQDQKLAESKAKAADYRARLAQYKANADPNIAIKKRLRDFIALAESVDFDAKVELRGYKQEFVRTDYRVQSNEWKLLYRIGREPVLAARDIARAWLNELI